MHSEKIKKSKRIGLRVSENDYNNLVKFSYCSPFSITDVLELGSIIFMEMYSKKTNLPIDLNMVLYKNIRLEEIQRETTKYISQQLKSKHLFPDKVMKDIFLYIVKKKTREEIIELLKSRKEESKHYLNNGRLTIWMDELITGFEQNGKYEELKNNITSFDKIKEMFDYKEIEYKEEKENGK